MLAALGRAVDEVAAIARRHGLRFMVRLVKGAYWDGEVKRAQELGLAGYPVFTHKHHTDISYLACAQALLGHADVIYPQFATHNAGTIAAILQMAARSGAPFELQRLHGMGEGVYREVLKNPLVSCRVYAPVGAHRDLLAYLVEHPRRACRRSELLHAVWSSDSGWQNESTVTEHVYRLRHTLAMRLLGRGVGIKAIGDVLGHRSFYGTSAYLRLDVAMLRGVALDVPAGQALQYARTLFPDRLRAVHLDLDPIRTEDLTAAWGRLGYTHFPLEIVECPDRRASRAVAEIVAREIIAAGGKAVSNSDSITNRAWSLIHIVCGASDWAAAPAGNQRMAAAKAALARPWSVMPPQWPNGWTNTAASGWIPSCCRAIPIWKRPIALASWCCRICRWITRSRAGMRRPIWVRSGKPWLAITGPSSRRPSDMTTSQTRPTIAIIGGGFSGAAVAFHLLRQSPAGSAQVVVIEPRSDLGRGLAYSTPDPAHRLNVPVRRMTLISDQPDHFHDWLARPTTPRPDPAAMTATGEVYVQRRIFGDYMRAQDRLDPALPLLLRGIGGLAVLKIEQRTTGLENPAHLAQHLGGVVDRTQGVGADHGIEAGIAKRYIFAHALTDFGGPAIGFGPLAGGIEQRAIGVDPGKAGDRIAVIQRLVIAAAATDLEHRAACQGHHLAAQGGHFGRAAAAGHDLGQDLLVVPVAKTHQSAPVFCFYVSRLVRQSDGTSAPDTHPSRGAILRGRGPIP